MTLSCLCYLFGRGGYVLGSIGLFVGLFVCLCVFLFVCLLAKHYELIAVKFYGQGWVVKGTRDLILVGIQIMIRPWQRFVFSECLEYDDCGYLVAKESRQYGGNELPQPRKSPLFECSCLRHTFITGSPVAAAVLSIFWSVHSMENLSLNGSYTTALYFSDLDLIAMI